MNLMVQILDSFQNLQQWISSINIANFWELSKEYKLLNLIAVSAYRSQHSHTRERLGIFCMSTQNGEGSIHPICSCLISSSVCDPFRLNHKNADELTGEHGEESCHRPTQNFKSPQKANGYDQAQISSDWSSDWMHKYKQEGSRTAGWRTGRWNGAETQEVKCINFVP